MSPPQEQPTIQPSANQTRSLSERLQLGSASPRSQPSVSPPGPNGLPRHSFASDSQPISYSGPTTWNPSPGPPPTGRFDLDLLDVGAGSPNSWPNEPVLSQGNQPGRDSGSAVSDRLRLRRIGEVDPGYSEGFFQEDGTPYNVAYDLDREGYFARYATDESQQAAHELYLNQRLDGVNERIKELPGAISAMESEVAGLRQERFQLASEQSSNQGSISSLYSNLQSLEGQLSQMSYAPQGMDPEVQMLRQRVLHLKRQIQYAEREAEKMQRDARMQQDGGYGSFAQNIENSLHDKRAEIWQLGEELHDEQNNLRLAEQFARSNNSQGNRQQLTWEISNLRSELGQLETRQQTIGARLPQLDAEIAHLEAKILEKRNVLVTADREYWERHAQLQAGGYKEY